MTLKKNNNIKDGMTMSRTWVEVVYCLFKYTKSLSLSFIVWFWLFHFYLSSKTCEDISNSLCLIFELFFDSRKTGHCNTFLLVECLIYQYQEIPERERFVFCCYSQDKEISKPWEFEFGIFTCCRNAENQTTNPLCVLGTERNWNHRVSQWWRSTSCKELLAWSAIGWYLRFHKPYQCILTTQVAVLWRLPLSTLHYNCQ